MIQESAQTKSKEPEDSALRYLMRADDAERKKWGEIAVALGFPREKLLTGNGAFDLLPWLGLVEQEMLEHGLWKPKPELESEKKNAKIIKFQLPLWPEPVRAIPNDILRSALFAAIQGKTRRFLDKEIIASVDGVVIKFTGKQLDQSDADVWEQAMHLARCHPLGHVCQFRGNAFLKSIGRSNGKSDYQWLDDSINRLIACAVQIRNGSRVFTGSLLSSCLRDETTGVYQLTLDQKTIKLFSNNAWSTVVWEQRQALMGKPLALWLHGFYSSHAAPFALKVETLRELSGSTEKLLRNFRQQLRKALDELKNCGAIADWQIDPDSDLVSVDRGGAITDSQRRHLAKSSPKRERKPKNKTET